MGISENLSFHVPGLGEELLHEALATSECRHCFTSGGSEGVFDVVVIINNLETTSTAAEGCLDGDGHAVLVGEVSRLFPGGDGIRGAGGHGRACLGGQGAGGDLVAQCLDGFWSRADPGQASIGDGLCELGVFGQEAVAGVHAVGAGAQSDVH